MTAPAPNPDRGRFKNFWAGICVLALILFVLIRWETDTQARKALQDAAVTMVEQNAAAAGRFERAIAEMEERRLRAAFLDLLSSRDSTNALEARMRNLLAQAEEIAHRPPLALLAARIQLWFGDAKAAQAQANEASGAPPEQIEYVRHRILLRAELEAHTFEWVRRSISAGTPAASEEIRQPGWEAAFAGVRDSAFAQGCLRLLRREYREAADDFASHLELYPSDAEALYLKGCAALRLEAWDEAGADFQRALQINDRAGSLWIARAGAAHARGRTEETVESLRHAARALPDASEPIRHLIDLLKS